MNNHNFFIISSDTPINKIESRLYGYVITDRELLINIKHSGRRFPFQSCGSYINIISNNDSVEVYQDYFGSYGLYLFKEPNGYFAISNSFLYLAEYLSTRFKLTINNDYAKAFLTNQTAILSYKETIYNEIIMLPRNCYIIINNQVNIFYYEQHETYIPLDSSAAFSIIDSWHNKWNNIIDNLLKQRKYVSCDLSGGKDSRASLSILFNRNLDIDKIHFN